MGGGVCDCKSPDFYGCGSLQNAAKYQALQLVILSSFCLGIVFTELMSSLISMPTDSDVAYYIAAGVFLAFFAIQLAMSILLGYAAIKPDCRKLRICGLCMGIVTVLCILGLVTCVAYCIYYNTFDWMGMGGQAILLFVWVLIGLYSVSLIKSFVNHIRDHPEEYVETGDNLETGNAVQSEDIEPGNVQPQHPPSDSNTQPQAENMQPQAEASVHKNGTSN